MFSTVAALLNHWMDFADNKSLQHLGLWKTCSRADSHCFDYGWYTAGWLFMLIYRNKKNISSRYLQHVHSRTDKWDWPAGTGTITLFLCLVWPVPRQELQGVDMTVPLPPQRRHVERITNGPVFTVSYREDDTCVLVTQHKDTLKTGSGSELLPCRSHCRSGSAGPWCLARCPYHRSAGRLLPC